MSIELEVGLSLKDLSVLSSLGSSPLSPDDLIGLDMEKRKRKALELFVSDDSIDRLIALYLQGKLSSLYPFMLAVSRKVLSEHGINHDDTILYIADMLTNFSRQENILMRIPMSYSESIELKHPLDVILFAEEARVHGENQYAFYAYQRAGQILLFISGIFPAYIYNQLRRHKGVKTMRNYEEIGAANFGRALDVGYTRHGGIERLADLGGFSGARRALNDASRLYFRLSEPFELNLARQMGWPHVNFH